MTETRDFLRSVEFFSACTAAELAELAGHAERRTYGFGDAVYNVGDPGAGLYVVEAGMVRIFSEVDGKEISMGVRKSGEVLAELAALQDLAHDAAARASAKTTLLFIPRQALLTLLAQNADAKAFITRYAAISAAGGLITRLFDLRGKANRSELDELIRSIGVKRLPAGGTLLEQDTRNDQRLYVIRQGQVSLHRHENGHDYPVATLRQGDLCGEKACLLRQAQPFAAVADTDAVLLVIPQQTVDFLLEYNPKLKTALEERIQFADRDLERQKALAERRARPVLLDLFSRPKRGERIIKRFPLVEQAEMMDCGAACLAMICKHYGLPMTLGKLRELANVTTEGATLDSLARVGESLGFTCRGVQATYQAMLGFELPFIAHWEGYHYVVVYGLSKHHVWLADPALGFRKLSRDEFERGWVGVCLLFTPGAEMAELDAQRSPWLRFVRFLRPHHKVLGYLILATLVIEVLGIAPPLIVQNILDRAVVHQSFNLLNVLIIGLILTHLFTQFTSLMRALLANFMVRNLDFAMMSQFFRHTLALPLAFFQKRRTGDIFARFQENLTIRTFLTESTVSTLLNVMMIFLYFIVMFMYNATLALVVVGCIIPLVLLTLLVTPKLKNYARDSFTASTDAEAILMETLSGAETVKAMGIERSMRLRWEKKYAKSLDVNYRAQRFEALVGLASQLLHAGTTVVILWYGSTLVLRQELSIGQLIAFNMLLGSVLAPLMNLVRLWDRLQGAVVAMERLGDVLDLEPEQKPADLPSRIVLPNLRGEVRLEGVYYRYGGEETPYVLDNISFAAKAGEVVAIVGPSGGGKSTLAKLLVGFHPPCEGKILIDNYDLALLDKEYYRKQIGYVLQNNLLFTGTIAENIAVGEDNPDRKRIVEAAKLADAHGFVSRLPLGYEQIIGERGMGLSGGQIQRICIARALYRDPRIVIFDEATSALDTQSESVILHTLAGALQGRTVFVVAHRLSTVMKADRILVLYDGHIVEQGRHQELLDKQGMYYELVQRQMAG